MSASAGPVRHLFIMETLFAIRLNVVAYISFRSIFASMWRVRPQVAFRLYAYKPNHQHKFEGMLFETAISESMIFEIALAHIASSNASETMYCGIATWKTHSESVMFETMFGVKIAKQAFCCNRNDWNHDLGNRGWQIRDSGNCHSRTHVFKSIMFELPLCETFYNSISLWFRRMHPSATWLFGQVQFQLRCNLVQ